MKDESGKGSRSKTIGGPEHFATGLGFHSVWWKAILGFQKMT